MRLSGMEMSEPSSEGRRCRSSRRDPSPARLVIAAAGYSDVVSVSLVDYVAQWAGYDTEGCIQKAMDDGYIDVCYPNLYGDRKYDTYRLTAKGRRAADRYMGGVFKRSAIEAKRAHEEREKMRRSGRDGLVPSQ